MPDLRAGKPAGSFRITEGVLYRASEFAKQPNSAALLIVDEINRGPTVQVFGGAIVAMEAHHACRRHRPTKQGISVQSARAFTRSFKAC